MKFFLIVFVSLLGACSSMTPPPECSGPVRKINPVYSVSAVTCEKGVA